MKRVVIRVVARHDPPNDFTAGSGKKKRRIPMLVKRVLPAIQELFPLEQQRGHPGGIMLIDPPREFDKGVAFRARTNLDDFHLGHCVLISAAAARCARPK